MSIAKKHNLFVIEDAAQAMMSYYKGKALGTIGDLGTFSFHETKNYNCGEGGVLLINNESLAERAEIIREKGTNRSKFFRGEVDKYTWVDIGSSFLPSELNAAYLYAQLENAEVINQDRKQSWKRYYEALKGVDDIEISELTPDDSFYNGHIFYLKTKSTSERDNLIQFLKNRDIMAIFHYIPLHSSPAGQLYGRVSGTMEVTERISKTLLRLPMFYGLTEREIQIVVKSIVEYFDVKSC